MKTTMTNVLLFFVFFFYPGEIQTQTQSVNIHEIFDKEEKPQVLSFGPVYGNQEVVGYFILFGIFKEGKYRLRLYDKDLNEIIEKKITDIPDLHLLEVLQTEEQYYLKFASYSEEKTLLRSLNRQDNGDIRELFECNTKYKRLVKEYPYTGCFARNKTMHLIEGVGLFDYSMRTESHKIDYSINFIPEGSEQSKWIHHSDQKTVEFAEFLKLQGDTLFSIIYKEKPEYRLESFVTATDIKTGEMFFEKRFSEDVLGIKPLRFQPQFSEDSDVLAGFYYPKRTAVFLIRKDKLKDDRGFFFAKTDKEGNLHDIKLHSIIWGQILEAMPKTKKAKPFKMCLHNIIQLPNGRFFLVIEATSKKYSEGFSEYMMLIQLDKNFKYINSTAFQKRSKRVMLDSAKDRIDSKPYYPYMSNIGYFGQDETHQFLGHDYAFTAKHKNNSDFLIGYLNDGSSRTFYYTRHAIKRKKGSHQDWLFGGIKYQNGQFSEKVIPLNSKAEVVRVLPADLEKVLVVEQFVKDGRIEMSLREVF